MKSSNGYSSNRTHKARVDAQRSGWSPAQRRAFKCEQSKARNAERKAARRAEAEARQAEYDALTLDQKVERAKAAPGRAARQLDRLYGMY